MSILREQVVKRLTRSSRWPSFIRAIKKLRKECAVCGKRRGLEGHHNKPFHLFPELELDPSNITILCRRHHFAIGHLEYWKSYNVCLADTISYFKTLLKGRP